MLGLLGRLDVLHDPGVGVAGVQLLRVGDHALEGPTRGAHALDRHDLVLEREDRLDLQRPAEPRLRLADAPAAAQILERVYAAPGEKGVARLTRATDDSHHV